jgi:hypothetical protein
MEVVIRIVANVPAPEFQKLWLYMIESLRPEY